MEWDQAPQPARRRNPALAIVGLLVVAALLAGVTVVAFDRTAAPRDIDAHVSSSPVTAVAPGPPPTATELEAVVADISSFVAKARKLQFKRPVEVGLLDDEAFSQRVRADAVEDLAALEETEGVLRALGLLSDDVRLADELASLLGDSVVGFYDPATDELVVRGAAITPYVRLTLAHELTHALDDQQFELDRPKLDDADDETGTGFSALVEGNALRIEDAYRETLTDGERKQAETEEARLGEGIDYSTIPRVLGELIGFPYIFGPGLLEVLVGDGGEARVNKAFDDPPITTEQVMDPQGWLSEGAAPVEVDPPVADGEVIDQGVLGLWGAMVLLEDELGEEGAIAAAQGWGGDWYVAWKRDSETCVRNTLVMDTADDLDELRSALEEWAAAQPDAEVERAAGSVTYTACG